MRIRSAAQLDLHLDKVLSWRKKELTSLKFAVDTAPAAEQKVLLRAAVTLLYAHWEGFVKEAGTAYLNFIAQQALPFRKLKPNFVAIGFRGRIRSCGQSDKVRLHAELVDRLINHRDEQAKLPWKGVVQTRSNLRAAVLQEILQALDLDFTPYTLKAKPVIDRLVDARNGIAHGKGIPVDEPDYSDLHSAVIAMLDDFKSQVESAANSKNFAA